MIRLCIILFLSFLMSAVSAQESDNPLAVNIIPPAPEAASLGKFIDMPISTYTGLPKVEIPLYQLKSYQLELPISLSYHASGLKIEEIPSSLGAGWALNAGAIVSRTIRGLNDEHAQGYLSTGTLNTIYSVPPFFDPNDPTSMNQLYLSGNTSPNCNGSTSDQYNNIYYASRGGLDLEPDLFFFTLPDGKSGKFVFDRQKNIKLIPKQHADIAYTLTGNGELFNTWQITGANGTRYYFEVSEKTSANNLCREPESIPHPENQQPSTLPQVDTPSTWKLTKMISANGLDSIIFEYEIETLSYTQSVAITDYDRISGFTGDIPSTFCKNFTTVRGQRLSKIIASNGYSVAFTYTNPRKDVEGGYSLDRVDIYYQQELIKYYTLAHHYISSGSAYERNCLMLNKVTEHNASGQALPPYALDYYQSMLGFSRSSTSVDHWGYYNGASSNQLNAPAMLFNQRFYRGANREPVLEHCQQGSLKQVTYPTGGKTALTYGLNEYANLPTTTEYPYTQPLEELAVIEFNITSNTSAYYTDTKNFTLLEDTDVIYLYVIPEIYGGGIAESGNSGTLTKGGSSFRVDYTVTGPTNPPVETLTAGSYTLTAEFNPGLFSWPPEHPLSQQQFYIKIYRVKNSVDVVTGAKMKGGGLRVEQVSQTGVNTYVKTYRYESKEGSSSGKLMSYPSYAYTHRIHDDTWDKINNGCITNDIGQFLVRTSMSNTPLTATQGSHVGYDRVIEYTGLPENHNGYVVYEYTNKPDELNHDPTLPFPFVPTKHYGHENGRLTKKEIYTKTGKLVSRTTNKYTYTGAENVGLGIKVAEGKRTNCLYCANREFVYRSYLQPTVKMQLTSTTEQLYDMDLDGYITTRQSFRYDNFDQVIRIGASTSEPWRSHVTERIYHTIDHTKVEEERQYYAIENPAADRLQIDYEFISGQKTVYNPFILPAEIHLAITDQQLLSGPEAFSTLYEKRLTFHEYGPVGNLLSFSKEGDVRNTFIWGYDHLYPVVQAVNASGADIAYSSFEYDPWQGNWFYSGTGGPVSAPDAKTGAKVFSSISGTFSKASLNASKNYKLSFWAKGSGTITINGVSHPVSTSWTLIRTSLSGITSVNVTLSGQTIDELRLYPADCQITTYTYDPSSKGMTSSTDSNGITTSYHYDGFKRLEYVKDHEGNILNRNEYHYALEN